MDKDQIDAAMAPLRARIDAVDAQLIELLAERYRIVGEVANFKAVRGIAPVQSARAQAVQDRAVAAGRAAGLDPVFVADIWARLIAHAHAMEGEIVGGA